MNKLKLTLSILALTVSQIASAENKFGPFTAKKNQLCEAP